MSQASFFDPDYDPPRPVEDVRVSGDWTETSAEAAASMQGPASGLRERVYDYLLYNGPATDETVAQMLSLSPNTARPRRIELVAKGLVEKCGTGITRSGRRAILWRAVA